MPKVQSGKNYFKKYSEADIEKALEAIKNGLGKRTAAKTFNIPRATLQFRLSKDFVKSRPGPDTILSKQEENQIVEWILESNKRGFPRRKEDVIKSVTFYLNKNPRPNCFLANTPGEGWFKLFLKRHPELSTTNPAATPTNLKASTTQTQSWFKQIEEYLKENNHFDILSDPTRVYHGDETNFTLCLKNKRVFGPKGEKNVLDRDQSKSCITVMFTFSADGEITPPMIIFPLKRMGSIIQNSVPVDWDVSLSENGFMTAELFIHYIQNVLHPALQRNKVIFPVILFVDGIKSHITLELFQLCQSLEIILISLYPYATRLLQPVDVASFHPIKTMWHEAVLDSQTYNSTKTIVRTDVGPILELLISKIEKPMLQNGFEAYGLCPFNPDRVDFTKNQMLIIPPKVILDENITPEMTYEKFQEIVGQKLMKRMKNSVVGKSVEAKKLYEIYKYLAPTNSKRIKSPKIEQSASLKWTQNGEENEDLDEEKSEVSIINDSNPDDNVPDTTEDTKVDSNIL